MRDLRVQTQVNSSKVSNLDFKSSERARGPYLKQKFHDISKSMSLYAPKLNIRKILNSRTPNVQESINATPVLETDVRAKSIGTSNGRYNTRQARMTTQNDKFLKSRARIYL